MKELNDLIEMKEPIKQGVKLIDIYMKRKNRYYGDINTNHLKEEKDDDWVKEIESSEKRPISNKPKVKFIAVIEKFIHDIII